MFTAGFQWDCTVGSKLTRLAGDLGNQIGAGFRYGDSLTSAAHFKAVFAGTFYQAANMRQRHGRTDGAALTFYLWAFALERTTPTPRGDIRHSQSDHRIAVWSSPSR